MIVMIHHAVAFNVHIWKWDLSNVTDMHARFSCAVVVGGNVAEWNVFRVQNKLDMFHDTAATS